jgi:hypothetical protein
VTSNRRRARVTRTLISLPDQGWAASQDSAASAISSAVAVPSWASGLMNHRLRALERQRHHTEIRRWAGAVTLQDLADLTALWLQGHLKSQPGYADSRGPDPETTELIPVLSAVNQVGFLTRGSQPGIPLQPGYDDVTFQQRAAVDGYAEWHIVRELRDMVAGTRLYMTFGHAPRWRRDYSDAMPVTYSDTANPALRDPPRPGAHVRPARA